MFLQWVVVFCIMTTMTIWEIYRNRKRIAYKLADGEKKISVIGHLIMLELVLDFAVFIITRIFVFLFFSGTILQPFVFAEYACSVLVSCLLYIYYLFYHREKLLAVYREDKNIIIPTLIVLIFLYLSVQQFFVNCLNHQFTNVLSQKGSKALNGKWYDGSWFYEQKENYNISSVRTTLFSKEVYCKIQRTDTPSDTKINMFEFSINSDLYFDDASFQLEYYVKDSEAWHDGFIDMDINGNYITIDAEDTEATEHMKNKSCSPKSHFLS